MTVEDAAKVLKITERSLRMGLIQNRFPFGTAIETTEGHHIYYINDERLQLYIEGKLIG